MPPRDSRMTAAIEAMVEFGFEPKLVRKKVTQLLKEDVYGEEGWHFIEEYCYSTLIEVLLADQANDDHNDGNGSLGTPNDRRHAETTGAGPSSSKAICPRNSRREKETETSGAGQSNQDFSAQVEPRGVDDTEPSIARRPRTSSRKVASFQNDPSGGSELETLEHVISSNLEVVNIAYQSNDVLDSASLDKALSNSTPTKLTELPETQGQEGTPLTDHAQQVATLPTKRRRPYYGWIGCEDDDLVVLSEAPLPQVLRKMFLLDMDLGNRKRKSKWDVQLRSLRICEAHSFVFHQASNHSVMS